ncbi:hypothetical protein BDD12DRAFT_981509, partial [Trichophaea hybrida]
MSFLGQNIREQPDPPQNEQPDSSGNEQGHLQGYGGSSVQPALERDGFFPPVPMQSIEEYIDLGASQDLTGGQNISRMPISHNTTTRHNISSSWNTTMTNSNNTVDNTRTYSHAKHDEFNHPTFYAPVTFGGINYHSSQPGPQMDARMHGVLQNLVQTISWDILSRHLSVINQDEYRSRIPPFNQNKPENFWISKNIDFTQWESAEAPAVLLLCAPQGHGMTEVCSHIVHLAMEKASWANGAVLYFFCSSAPNAQCSAIFTHTLLYEIFRYSHASTANSIAVDFLSTLVWGHFQRRALGFREDDPLDNTVKKILDVPDKELIQALAEAIRKAGVRKLSIIIDSLWHDDTDCFIQYIRFVQCIMEAVPELKALVTSRHNSPDSIPDGFLCIEYDKERKECLRFLQHDDTRYHKIS